MPLFICVESRDRMFASSDVTLQSSTSEKKVCGGGGGEDSSHYRRAVWGARGGFMHIP